MPHGTVGPLCIAAAVDRRVSLGLAETHHCVGFRTGGCAATRSGNRSATPLRHDGSFSAADDDLVSVQTDGRLLVDSWILVGKSDDDPQRQGLGDGHRGENVCRLPPQADDNRLVQMAARLFDFDQKSAVRRRQCIADFPSHQTSLARDQTRRQEFSGSITPSLVSASPLVSPKQLALDTNAYSWRRKIVMAFSGRLQTRDQSSTQGCLFGVLLYEHNLFPYSL